MEAYTINPKPLRQRTKKKESVSSTWHMRRCRTIDRSHQLLKPHRTLSLSLSPLSPHALQPLHQNTTNPPLPAMAAAAAAHGSGEYLRQFVEETGWYNEIFLSAVVPGDWWRGLPHPLRSWLRNCVGGYFLYFISGFLWCFVIYYWKRHAYIPKDSIPTVEAMKRQILVATKAMPFYSALPTISEYMIESGWTWCFFHVSDMGWPMYLVYVALYLSFVEFGIYWMHRELHDIKPLYKYLHATHHIYNKENTLSPFAGLAFHPLDGILQAIPHVFALFLIPTHFRTHIALLFLEAVWTTNIHDCIHGKVWPVMGAGYHTIHHTTYRHNYGHYTVWMDWLFGTLREPEYILKKD